MNSICKHRGEKTHSAPPITEIGISGRVRDEEKKPVVDQVLWRQLIKLRLSPPAVQSHEVKDYWAGKWHDNTWQVSKSKNSIPSSQAKMWPQRLSSKLSKRMWVYKFPVQGAHSFHTAQITTPAPCRGSSPVPHMAWGSWTLQRHVPKVRTLGSDTPIPLLGPKALAYPLVLQVDLWQDPSTLSWIKTTTKITSLITSINLPLTMLLAGNDVFQFKSSKLWTRHFILQAKPQMERLTSETKLRRGCGFINGWWDQAKKTATSQIRFLNFPGGLRHLGTSS